MVQISAAIESSVMKIKYC